ncbi:MAG TPA: RNase adapter RapZ [Propionibacteriaceae bacterium]|nr:RNase adapter RapZ [Propionibacteriaceae bacterium]HPZ49985.1 RNase adapter RapZ [Propionibacteriaceae bacterium]HQE32582.1 RNase adapter RapZ [Propionibacteriaceae bacterium]
MTETQPSPESPAARVVIITGMSGAGRRTAAHAMEDHGWYVVDNLPPLMIPALSRLLREEGLQRLAVGLDVRSRGDFEQLPAVFAELAEQGTEPEVLFLEASDEMIVKRQESSRRPVPLQGEGRLIEGIQRERRMMSTLRASADMVVDTTNLNVHQLATRVAHAYGGEDRDELRVTIVSFGFKNGIPIDADLVFDVRFLPNPHWVPELRPQTGLSASVSEYVLSQPGAEPFMEQLLALFATMRAGYARESKRLVELAIGCTGGKHRSTAVSEEVARRLRADGIQVQVVHRDLGRE